MCDSEWLRGIADSGRDDDEWPPDVKAMLRRAADRLDEAGRLEAMGAKVERLKAALATVERERDAAREALRLGGDGPAPAAIVEVQSDGEVGDFRLFGNARDAERFADDEPRDGSEDRLITYEERLITYVRGWTWHGAESAGERGTDG